jgi:glycosyltransferase involved in cell wall biosynthesis
MRALRQILAEFDVLHFHAYIPALGRAALNSAARIVYTEHGNFGFGRPATLQDILRRHLLGRFLKSRVDFLSFNSHFTREIAESRYNLQSVRREVVYNGIQLKKDEPSAESISSEIRSRIEGQFVVGTCSRFAGFKRIDRLIEAFATFSANRKAVLLLLGDGPLRGQLMAQAASLGIADKVIFAGYQEQVRAYQQRMDLSVLPSEREPFGLAALETLSLGTPTLVFQDAGGLAEVVQHCNTADVVSDVTALTRRMEHYYATGRGDAAARDARIDYTRKFGIDAMAGAFAVIYNRIGRDHES